MGFHRLSGGGVFFNDGAGYGEVLADALASDFGRNVEEERTDEGGEDAVFGSLGDVEARVEGGEGRVFDGRSFLAIEHFIYEGEVFPRAILGGEFDGGDFEHPPNPDHLVELDVSETQGVFEGSTQRPREGLMIHEPDEAPPVAPGTLLISPAVSREPNAARTVVR